MGAKWRNSSRWRKLKTMVKRSSDGFCYICGGPLDFSIRQTNHPGFVEVDHIIAVDVGGDPFSFENLAAVHLTCNRVKGTRSIESMQLKNTISLMVEAQKKVVGSGLDWFPDDGDGDYDGS